MNMIIDVSVFSILELPRIKNSIQKTIVMFRVQKSVKLEQSNQKTKLDF